MSREVFCLSQATFNTVFFICQILRGGKGRIFLENALVDVPWCVSLMGAFLRTVNRSGGFTSDFFPPIDYVLVKG